MENDDIFRRKCKKKKITTTNRKYFKLKTDENFDERKREIFMKKSEKKMIDSNAKLINFAIFFVSMIVIIFSNIFFSLVF